jgi:hypothetical protein
MNLSHFFFGLSIVVLLVVAAYFRAKGKPHLFWIVLALAAALQLAILAYRSYNWFGVAGYVVVFVFEAILAIFAVDEVIERRSRNQP